MAREGESCVVLLSGGLDSATALAIARRKGLRCFALSFDYGQRHRCELAAAAKVAAQLGVEEHVTVQLDLRAIGGSALTADIEVPKDRDAGEIGRRGEAIPVTYVPARNMVFLSVAIGWAEVLEADEVFIGVNALDYSGYPDCRPEFIAAFERAAQVGTKVGVEGARIRIHAPLIVMSKAQIIRRAMELGVDLALTISCYDPDGDGRACGRCDACILRRRGFEEAQARDPARSGAGS
jgi:7-cyano-7-deazaguanine synthase